jgi:hypothetical protein
VNSLPGPRKQRMIGLFRSFSTFRLAVVAAFVCLILLQTFIPMIGSQWQPQGRYLFPAMVIFATLFAYGLRRLKKPVHWRPLSALYVACFLLLDALCLLGYIVPHYYG